MVIKSNGDNLATYVRVLIVEQKRAKTILARSDAEAVFKIGLMCRIIARELINTLCNKCMHPFVL